MIGRLLGLVRRLIIGFFTVPPDHRDKMIEALMKQNADLLDRLQETIGQIHYHQVQQAAAAQESLHVSEEEEDLRFAHAEGLLDEQALKDALQDLHFQNSEITLG